MAPRNLITDVGMVQIASSDYWNQNVGLQASTVGTRMVTVTTSGTPVGQERRVYGPQDHDVFPEAGQFVVCRVRACTNANNGLGDWSPSGPMGRLGIAFWDHGGFNAQGLMVDIPWGILGGGVSYPEHPAFHDVEIVHEVGPGDVGFRTLWKIDIRRGDRPVYIDCPSAEMYVVDDLEELDTGPGGGEPPTDEPPTAPDTLTTTIVGPNRVTLEWSPGDDDTGVVGYHVYQWDNDEPVRVNPVLVQSLTFTVTELEPWTYHTFTVRAVDTAGQLSDNSPEVTVRTALPAPDVDGNPWELHAELAEALAPRVASYVGRAMDPETTAAAAGYIPVVTEYVRGYTRGRGFKQTGLPSGAILAVIVSAAARLVANPEQVSYYSTGDYTERPAVLAGWTLAELAVLHRYRRRAA